ncbi:PREDICTED: carbonic anhydrase 1-like [Priapulus caudatus]|uniref:carbonic anhydrase n=1 Tax=Priapulus caudatus TaxID=37621 RepID=A0ABM1DZN9_PRICU|nr:PREDICTED: carbonic anhydrase 1-like [Priapulus caudatus]XP_014665410.1 PREDICTED: carbonic anhydrase 1-like [Priapulus caudatus]XP_014665411.1 PREDICTED: carbonic anhydrase 1-like [Priapulus caudatus]
MASEQWIYEGEGAPEKWPQLYPASGGKCQSPIDIKTRATHFDATMTPVCVNYVPEETTVVNTGWSFQIPFKGKDSYIKGGPLNYKYQLAQLHFHWGSSASSGSEHTVDGKSSAGELHIVHWNSDRYGSVKEAAQHADGLAVLGFLIRVKGGDEEHSKMKTVTDALAKIPFKGDSHSIGLFSPGWLMPDDLKQYWTYNGSLTTPPCSEAVSWLVFKNTLPISAPQLNAFRSLHWNSAEKTNACDMMVDNWRPVQELGGRRVRASFT